MEDVEPGKLEAVEDEQMRGDESADENGQQKRTPEQAGKEVRHGAGCGADAEGGERTALDAGHDPDDEQKREEGDAIAEDDDEGCMGAAHSLLRVVPVDAMQQGLKASRHDKEDGGVEEQAPTGAKAIPTEEDAMERMGVRRRRGGGERRDRRRGEAVAHGLQILFQGE